MNIEQIQTLGTGTAGVALVEAASALPTPDEISSIGQILIQIAIGLATVWRVLKKNRNDRKNNTPEDGNE